MKEHLIIAINGAAGCGKSTFVHYCKEFADTLAEAEVREISIVDWVKRKAKELGWDGKSKTNADRDFLAGLKDLTDRYNGAPFEQVTRFLNRCYRDFKHQIVFVHLRQKKDIERLRDWTEKSKYWQFQVAYVERDGIKPVTTNAADREVLDTKDIADMTILNSGNLGDLQQAADDLVSDVINGRVTAMFYGTIAETEGGAAMGTYYTYRIVGQKDISKDGGYEKSIDVPLTSAEHTGVSKFLNALDESTAMYPFCTISSIKEE